MNTVLRILDANSNRATEAIRVVEESARFGRSDSFLAHRAKEVRHRVSHLIRQLRSTHGIERCRDILGDVGTGLSIESERSRDSLDDVVRASFARLKESLRCLEEYSKVLDSEIARGFERARYDTYHLEQTLLCNTAANVRLANVRLYGLVSAHGDETVFAARVRSLAKATDALQLREKQLPDAALLRRAKLFVENCRGECLSIINDRPDIAVAVNADGVHLGQEDLPVKVARQVGGPSMLVGRSTHNISQARSAVLDAADYIGVGPTFPSTTKEFDKFPGLDFVSAVSREIDLPAFAIGGVDATNARQVAAAGLPRVAVGAFLLRHGDPIEAAKQVRDALQLCNTSPEAKPL